MKKKLLTIFATILMSTMIVIPVLAATPAEGATSGAFIGIPGELGAQTQTEDSVIVGQEEDPGDIEENKELMDAFGGVDKYHASYERVTPEYFKQKYDETAEFLKDKIDTTSTDTIISSATTAVNNHFTKRWSELGLVDFYAFDQKIQTDYLLTGRMFSGFEPAVLLHTILDSYGIENDLWDGETDSYTMYVAIPMNDFTRYVAFGGETAVTSDTTPTGLCATRLADMYMGAYKDFID